MHKFIPFLFLVFLGLFSSWTRAEDAIDAYRLRHGDSISVAVWREESLQKEVLVLPDGSITFPLAGRIDVAGLSSAEVEKRLAEKLKAFIPELKKRPEAQIANVSSMGGYGPVPGQSVYGASKAAIKLLTEALRAELTETSIRVTGIFPGAIGTNIAGNSGIKMDLAAGSEAPKMKMTAPADAGRIMIDGIEANKARVFVGKDAAIMDKLVRFMPVKSGEIIYNQMKSILPKN